MWQPVYKSLALIVVLAAVTLVFLHLASRKIYPMEFGLSFNQKHAAALGLDWRQVYTAMLDDLQPKYVRIAAMWSEVEKTQSVFDFRDVDFMMDEAGKRGVKVLLVVGQKAPRWPECHVPDWLDTASLEAKTYLQGYLAETVNRYQTHSALELWQVENEPFIRFRFGECRSYRPEYLSDEISLVRSLDQEHRIMVTDSGELSTWHRAISAGDLFGTTMYRIVRTPSGKIFTYDWLPAAYYRLKARIYRRPLAEVYISELQAEPWFTHNNPLTASLAEQERTMNPERFVQHLEYARRTGFPRAYLWGVEWWYFMRENYGESRYWDLAREQIAAARAGGESTDYGF